MAYSKTEEYYQRVINLIDANDVLISTEAKVKNCERIARLCDVLGRYKDCAELKEKYTRLAAEERSKGKERDYQNCLKKYSEADSIDSYRRAEILLSDLGDYKDSRQLAAKCRERRLKMKLKSNIHSVIRFIIAAVVITGLVLYVRSITKNDPDQIGVSVANISRGIRISWSQEEEQDDKYIVIKSVMNPKTKEWSEDAVIATVSGKDNYVDDEVYPGSTYRYAVKLDKEEGSGTPAFYNTMVRITTREIESLTQEGPTAFRVKWSGSRLFTGYQVQYTDVEGSFSKADNVMIGKKNTYSYTAADLKENTTYYVRVRSYHSVNGVIYYGGWSPTAVVSLGSYAD